MRDLGVMFSEGRAVERNQKKAVQWFRKAAELGDPLAQINLGACYIHGDGVAQSNETAVEWYTRAVEQGSEQAESALGWMYAQGRGVPRDWETAIELLKQAADKGSQQAERRLGLLYYQGNAADNVPQSFELAAEWWLKAATKGDAKAQEHLTAMYKAGEGTAKHNAVESAVQRAKGNPSAFGMVDGDQEFPFKLPMKAETARLHKIGEITKKAEQGDAEAQTELGNMFYRGSGVAKDLKKAAKWYTKAAEQRYALAQRHLAIMYLEGIVPEEDSELQLEKAGNLIARAAAQGDLPAIAIDFMMHGPGNDALLMMDGPINLALLVLLAVLIISAVLCYRCCRCRSSDRAKLLAQQQRDQKLKQKQGRKKLQREEAARAAEAEERARNKDRSELRRRKDASKRQATEQAAARKAEHSKRRADKLARRLAAEESAIRAKEEKQAAEKAKVQREKRQAAAKQAADATSAAAKAKQDEQAKTRQARDNERQREETRRRAAAAREEKEKVRKQEITAATKARTAAAASGGGELCVGSLTVFTGLVLGEGSMGTRVYRGVHADGREVAVKVMDKTVVPEHRARRELQLMQELAEGEGRGRQHVIQYRCLEEEKGPRGRVLLGMELCDGGSLHDIIDGSGVRVPLKHQIRIARELCEAVAFLHQHQIVHRDIRPKNILFKQSSGYEGTLKLTDFGLSKDLQSRDLDQSFSTTTTQAGTEIGSFGYYAPEVYRMERPTPKVDIFSAGCCIFYTCSNGGRPFADAKQPFNKYLVQTNILTGRSNLRPIAQTQPEAVELISSMIDVEAIARPSMEQALQHPLFWNDETRFQFLCAVGREEDVMGNKPSATSVLKPGLVQKGWHKAMAAAVYEHYTTGDFGRTYDTGSTTHLLRFLRNCEAHPPPQDSTAQAVLAADGGMACYFVVQCFPELAMRVRRALVQDLGTQWRERIGLRSFLHSSSTTHTHPGAVASSGGDGQRQWSSLQRLPPSALTPTVPEAGELEQWLVSIHPALAVYAAALTDYGFEDLDFVREVDEADFAEALEAVGMAKQGHRALALKRFRQLKQEG
eukprot:g1411.t1